MRAANWAGVAWGLAVALAETARRGVKVALLADAEQDQHNRHSLAGWLDGIEEAVRDSFGLANLEASPPEQETGSAPGM